MPIVLLISTENELPIELTVSEKCTIGRSSGCDIALKDIKVSNSHGLFELNKGKLYYTDLDSRNGSLLNNLKINKTQFKLGETLKLGNTTITIDEKRLNRSEAIFIGKSTPGESSEPASNGYKEFEIAEKSGNTKTIKLSAVFKSVKKKLIK